MPFTQTQFLDLFGAFNGAFPYVLAVLWFVSAAVAVQLVRGRARSDVVSAVAALHWAWAGVAYHALFFTRINAAAWLFAALFLTQALGFVWWGVAHRRLIFSWGHSVRHVWAAVFLAYSLCYPALVVLTGHPLPRAPAFGVPCPTALFTAGLLLAATPPVPRLLLVVPIFWSVVGGSAALLFGMTPDLMLFVAGATLAFYGVGTRRPRLFDWGTTEAERRRAMVGDTDVPTPNYEATLAISIDAPPDLVWPWLVQMGYQRGGLYSYDWLDRLFGYLDRPSADRLLPAFQELHPGDVIPVGRGPGFPVTRVEPHRALVLGGETEEFAWVWAFGLYPIDGRRTRLVSRNRARVPSTVTSRLFMCVLAPAAFVMTRKMLLGIKRRAEALAMERREVPKHAA